VARAATDRFASAAPAPIDRSARTAHFAPMAPAPIDRSAPTAHFAPMAPAPIDRSAPTARFAPMAPAPTAPTGLSGPTVPAPIARRGQMRGAPSARTGMVRRTRGLTPPRPARMVRRTAPREPAMAPVRAGGRSWRSARGDRTHLIRNRHARRRRNRRRPPAATIVPPTKIVPPTTIVPRVPGPPPPRPFIGQAGPRSRRPVRHRGTRRRSARAARDLARPPPGRPSPSKERFIRLLICGHRPLRGPNRARSDCRFPATGGRHDDRRTIATRASGVASRRAAKLRRPWRRA